MAELIPISTVDIGAEEEALVVQVLRSGHLAQGPMVERLEHEFAAICGVPHAIAVANGTVSLVAALAALGVGPGDEVITSPFTFVATINAILAVGATARLVDIGLEDYCLDPAAVEAAVNERTAAIMPVHLYGQTADMGAIMKIAERHGLAVIEDAAQAHGAHCGGQAAGSFGVGSFSFYATKNVTTAEGGVITTSDAALADKLRILRNQGMRARYQYEVVGHNWRMTDVAAAIGLPQLARLTQTNERRQANAAALNGALEGLPGVVVPRVMADRAHVWHQYTLAVDGRDALMTALAQAKIGHGIYYPKTAHQYECYAIDARVVGDAAPLADLAATRVLSLPVHPKLASGDLERIVGAVTDWAKGTR